MIQMQTRETAEPISPSINQRNNESNNESVSKPMFGMWCAELVSGGDTRFCDLLSLEITLGNAVWIMAVLVMKIWILRN